MLPGEETFAYKKILNAYRTRDIGTYSWLIWLLNISNEKKKNFGLFHAKENTDLFWTCLFSTAAFYHPSQFIFTSYINICESFFLW